MRLSPDEAVAALRSFPRRFRAALALVDDDETPLHEPGPDGRSALEHADLAGRGLAVFGHAVAAVLDGDAGPLRPSVVDEPPPGHADPACDPRAALDLVELEAGRLADRAAHVPAEEWARTAEVVGGGHLAALDLLREAVAATAGHLRAAERARGA